MKNNLRKIANFLKNNYKTILLLLEFILFGYLSDIVYFPFSNFPLFISEPFFIILGFISVFSFIVLGRAFVKAQSIDVEFSFNLHLLLIEIWLFLFFFYHFYYLSLICHILNFLLLFSLLIKFIKTSKHKRFFWVLYLLWFMYTVVINISVI